MLNVPFNCPVSNTIGFYFRPQGETTTMSTKRNVIISAVIAAVIAVTLVSATAINQGLLGSKSTTSVGQATTTPQPGTGTLAVLLTDPPTVPNGVTALYATYNNLEVHVKDAGNQSGWYSLDSSGTVNLMGMVNVSQTIATANLPNGIYNALRYNITSALVTYEGSNHTALMVENQEGTRILTIPIVGGIDITSAQSATAVIDLTPTVLLLGNVTNPTFAFIGAATAYTLPANSLPIADTHIGARIDMNSIGSWYVHQSRFEITSVSLSPTSLSITVQNIGNTSLVFRFAAVSATSTQSGGWAPIWSDSAIFVVQSNQSLVPLSASSKLGLLREAAAGGYLVAPGQSATFTYSGTITVGPSVLPVTASAQSQTYGNSSRTSIYGNVQPQSIVSGQKYIVSIQGSGVFAQTAVIAS